MDCALGEANGKGGDAPCGGEQDLLSGASCNRRDNVCVYLSLQYVTTNGVNVSQRATYREHHISENIPTIVCRTCYSQKKLTFDGDSATVPPEIVYHRHCLRLHRFPRQDRFRRTL